MSIPGQTMGIAAFTDRFIEDFGISRTELSFAYLLGTLASALFLLHAGKFYDEHGARVSMVTSSIFLGLFVAAIATMDTIVSDLTFSDKSARSALLLILLTLAFAGTRFFGQGLLTMASKNLLLVWFRRRRGFITGIRSTVVTLFYSAAPLGLSVMNETLGWRTALLIVAVLISVGFGGWSLLLVRDAPCISGLRTDGDETTSNQGSVEPYMDLAKARSTAVFWLFALTLGLYSLVSTAVIFHVSSIFLSADRATSEGFAFFLPVAVIATTTNLVASWLSDRIAMKPFLIAALASCFASCCGFLLLESDSGLCIAVLAYGIGGGLWSLMAGIAFVRLFGSKYLGAISGLNATISVVGSAGGPFVFGFFFDAFGTYDLPFLISAGVCVVLCFLACLNRHQECEPGSV